MIITEQDVTQRLRYEIRLSYQILTEIQEATKTGNDVDDLGALGFKLHAMPRLWKGYTNDFLQSHGISDDVRHLLATIDEVTAILDRRLDQLRVPKDERPTESKILQFSLHPHPFVWDDAYEDPQRNYVIGLLSGLNLQDDEDEDELIGAIYRVACKSMGRDEVTPIHLEIYIPSRMYVLEFKSNV